MSNKAQKDILAYLDILIYRAQAAEWTLVDLYGRERDQLVLVEGFIEAQQAAGQEGFKAVFKQPKVQAVQDLFDQLPIQSLRDLAINGQDIIQEINPENKRAIGQMLQFLEQAVVAQDVVNDRAALLAYLDTHHDQINEI